MLIDWFTVIAQVVNFLILVWLLKRFLYKPILAAIDAREKAVANELADADTKKAEAQKEHDDFQHKNDDFDQQRAALLAKATTDANTERDRLLGEARKAADALSAKRQEAMNVEATTLSRAITQRTQDEVFAIARKALIDLAGSSLEERVTAVFTRRLHDLDDAAKSRLGEALKADAESALVQTAFDLPPDQKAVIQNALNQAFSADIHLRFETAPALVSGIELTAKGQRLGWSIGEYLTSLQQGVEEVLKQNDSPKPQAASAPAVAAKSS